VNRQINQKLADNFSLMALAEAYIADLDFVAANAVLDQINSTWDRIDFLGRQRADIIQGAVHCYGPGVIPELLGR
jgi:hypothetical protein